MPSGVNKIVIYCCLYRGTDSTPSVDGESEVDEREVSADSAAGREDSQLSSADHLDMLGKCDFFQNLC